VRIDQYYLFDSAHGPDWSMADETVDGVVAPLSTGISVCTGCQHGIVLVRLLFTNPGRSYRRPATSPLRPTSSCRAESSNSGDSTRHD
jgi:hypothetical protein